MTSPSHAALASSFRALHGSGCFLLPNPWDVGSARFLHRLAAARVAWGAFMRAARDVTGSGSFDGLADAATFAELNALFERP